MYETIRRIFFDSGMVLVYPRSGEWFYPLAHRDYCERRGLPEKGFRQNLNFRVAYAELARRKLIATEAEELEAFRCFYATLFRGVDGKDRPDLVESCARASVLDRDKYAFYDDVAPALERLRSRFDLGIISDAWPSLLSVYGAAGMRRHFEPFIISSMYGCTKEGRDLFRFALANVAEHPEEILFVDDSPDNCRRARDLGMQALVMSRNGRYKGRRGLAGVSGMAGLAEVLGLC
jgi:haloacid dehalogenase superfamily, subfamily IA, variant 3 with third motif having DD or ED